MWRARVLSNDRSLVHNNHTQLCKRQTRHYPSILILCGLTLLLPLLFGSERFIVQSSYTLKRMTKTWEMSHMNTRTSLPPPYSWGRYRGTEKLMFAFNLEMSTLFSKCKLKKNNFLVLCHSSMHVSQTYVWCISTFIYSILICYVVRKAVLCLYTTAGLWSMHNDSCRDGLALSHWFWYLVCLYILCTDANMFDATVSNAPKRK